MFDMRSRLRADGGYASAHALPRIIKQYQQYRKDTFCAEGQA